MKVSRISFIHFCLLILVGFSNLAYAQTIIPPIDIAKLISGQHTLRLGYMANLPPFWFPGPTAKGMNADIFHALTSTAGFKNVTTVSFANMKELKKAMQQGKIDMISAFDTPEAQQFFILTQPFYRVGGIGILYDKHKYNFHTVADLKRHIIGIYEGSFAESWLFKRGILQNSIKIYPTVDDMIMALKHGNVDVVAGHYTYLKYTQSQNPDNQIAILLAPLKLGYALRKQDTQLQQAINSALEKLWSNGRLYHIKIKYLKSIHIQPQRY